jgi:hypothetical protein
MERGAQRTVTLDDTQVASRPGKLRVSFWRWSLRYPKWPVIIIGSLILTLVLSATVSLMFIVALPLTLIPNYLYWFRVREHFMHGDANPGLVVDCSPTLIAVWTDMTRGEGSHPMLRICRESSSGRAGATFELGERVATVGLYDQGEIEDAPYWERFDPRVVEPVAASKGEARRLLDSFTSEEWAKLERACAEVETLQEGLFSSIA